MSSSKSIPSNSKLIDLNPVFDKGLVKVGGGIRPVNIPIDHPLTQFTARNVHEDNLHVGKDHAFAIIRQKY